MNDSKDTSRDATASDGNIALMRVFNAPREITWKAWTNSRHLAQWRGPLRFTNPVCEIDVRPADAIRIHMRAPDGTVYPMSGTFLKVIEPELLIFASAALDEKENPLFEVLNTITFKEYGTLPAVKANKTKLIIHASVSNANEKAASYLAGMEAGWTQSLERLNSWIVKNIDGSSA
jgi:uncharacterized protein YndB with AHSA1/START domain